MIQINTIVSTTTLVMILATGHLFAQEHPLVRAEAVDLPTHDRIAAVRIVLQFVDSIGAGESPVHIIEESPLWPRDLAVDSAIVVERSGALTVGPQDAPLECSRTESGSRECAWAGDLRGVGTDQSGDRFGWVLGLDGPWEHAGLVSTIVIIQKFSNTRKPLTDFEVWELTMRRDQTGRLRLQDVRRAATLE